MALMTEGVSAAQLDLWAPTAAPPAPPAASPAPPPPAAAAPKRGPASDRRHAPGPWTHARIGYRMETATCLRCSRILLRPAGVEGAQLLRYDTYRRGITTAGVCSPVPRRWWGPKPGRETIRGGRGYSARNTEPGS